MLLLPDLVSDGQRVLHLSAMAEIEDVCSHQIGFGWRPVRASGLLLVLPCMFLLGAETLLHFCAGIHCRCQV